MSEAHSAGGGGKRLAIVAPTAMSILRLRNDLTRAALALGHKVLCLAPDADGEVAIKMAVKGLVPRAIPLRQQGLSVLADRRIEKALAEELSRWRPDAVLAYGARPMALGAVAARRAGIAHVVSLVNGLPAAGLAGPSVDGIGRRHYARAFKASSAVVVHNCDDAARLAAAGVVPKGTAIASVAGAGVDLVANPVQPLPMLGEGLVYLMIAPLLRSRGVAEYAAAAEAVKSRARSARFLLAGPAATGPDAISPDRLGPAVEYLGEIDDVRQALARTHVYVYASHAEGMPRSVLEAMAAGRPIVTTSVPGCRDTVDERVNGCLVPPGDIEALADAMSSFMKRLDLMPAMCRASRVKAERRFDVHEVNRVLLELLALSS